MQKRRMLRPYTLRSTRHEGSRPAAGRPPSRSGSRSSRRSGGTHLDAPVHFAEGRHTTDQIPLDQLVGPALVVDVSRQAGADRDYRITNAARLLVARRVRAVGIDTPSIDHGQSTTFETHQTLFAADIPAFENVAHLSAVPATRAFVVALPMKIRGESEGPLRIAALLPPGSVPAIVP